MRSTPNKILRPALMALVVFLSGWASWTENAFWVGEVQAQVLPGSQYQGISRSDIRNTRHNLSSTAKTRQATSGAVTTEPVLKDVAVGGEVCVFCHTPHGSSENADRPLWNKTDSAATYTGYRSTSLQATVDMSVPATPAKLCLSCHDGTIAVGQVNNAPGPGPTGATITMTGYGAVAPSPANSMPYGRNQANANHGFTRRLGTDLRNDHPVSFTFDTALASADGELRNPATSASPVRISNRAVGVKPDFPLYDGRVQCPTCHEPHRNTQMFLRKNRLVQNTALQQSAWNDWSFTSANDQICMGCHTRLGKAWQQSAHAGPTTANEEYLDGPATARDFPVLPTKTKVWQAGCLNCHDTHTVAGSRSLLREGVNSPFLTLSNAQIGYDAQIRAGVAVDTGANLNTSSAIENTCFQCHSDGVSGRPPPVISTPPLTANEGVPNIAAEYAKAVRMPLVNADQGDFLVGNSFERHEVIDNNGTETQINLGFGVKANRHAECTDCHNPHRVLKNSRFDNNGIVQRTHEVGGTVALKGADGNIASGALRGIWGVEPNYTNVSTTKWPRAPTSYTVKKGDPASNSSISVGDTSKLNTFLTREYQLCFKCHSDYANGPLVTDFPRLKAVGNTRGGTPIGTNGVMRYTNVAAEFAVNATDPPTGGNDQGEAGNNPLLTPSGSPPADCVGAACGTGNPAGANQPYGDDASAVHNHRSWHPVIWPTGRTTMERTGDNNIPLGNIRAPFDDPAKIGYQTMQCSDCHGSGESWSQGVGPDLTKVQGPHGSNNPFLLKGIWTDSSPTISTARGANTSGSLCGRCHKPTEGASGFFHSGNGKEAVSCSLCHMAVPHGWKNKAFLNNLNCIGDEVAGYSAGCSRIAGDSSRVTISPYYMRAGLRITRWARSTTWTFVNCNGNFNGDGPGIMPAPCGDGT